jgi:phosphatidylserine/phosphatidylglycerophosphate/cardiolipin synthase-like enzyme
LSLTVASLIPVGSPIAFAATNTHVLITEVYYDTNVTNEPEEYVAIYNPTVATVDISGWQVSNGTYTRAFPSSTSLAAGQTIYVSKNATRFNEQLAFKPNFEYGGNSDSTVPDMVNTTVTAPTFANAGDEAILKNQSGTFIDTVVYGTGNTSTTGWSGTAVPTVSGGQVMFRARDEATITATSAGTPTADTDTAADWKWGTQWRTERTYSAGQGFLPYPSYTFTGNITAYSMPDSAYSALGSLIDGATTSIDLNLYEFQLSQLKDKLVSARGRGVAVRVFLEGGPVGGLVDQGKWVAQELYNAGAQVRFIVNETASSRFQRYDYDHAKYAIVDSAKVAVQSENWKETGTPVDNSYGNRGWGVIIENSSYAAFLQQVFNSDWNPNMPDSFPFTPGDAKYGGPTAGYVPVTGVTTGSYVSPFASQTFSGTHTVTPVVIPEDGLLETKGIIGLMKSATKTLYVEQLYIHKYWGPTASCSETTCPDLYLSEVLAAARRGVKVRVVLDSAFLDTTDPKDNTYTRDYINQIAAAEGLDMEARLINLTVAKVEKVHNKGIIVDGQKTLVSSINWSENSPTDNREMGVIIDDAGIADFYTDIFYYDWYNGTPVNWVTLSEVMYDPVGTESDEEWLELYNPTAAAVGIGGWQLKDNTGTWNIPAGTTINAGQYLTVARNCTAFRARWGVDAGLCGLTLSLANTGDVVRLVNASTFEVDRVAWNSYLPNWSISASEGTTITRTSPGKDTNSRLDWTSNATATPGR